MGNMTHSDQQNGKKSALASSKDDRTLQEFGIDTSPTFPNGVINTSQPSMTLSCHQNEKSSSSAEDKANAFDGDEKYDGFRDTVVHFENASELLDGTPTEKEAGGNPDLEPILPEDEDVKEELLEGDAAVADITAGVGQKKKKKKRKPKSQRGLKNPTGFEDYYVDAPVTPAEHEQEKGMYDMSRPFTERIETAIQRFEAKRNLDSIRSNLFGKYLKHGGIKGGPKMFTGGLDQTILESHNAQDITSMTATHFVDFDKSDAESDIYVVDFEGCLKAFFSSSVLMHFELPNQEVIKLSVGLIRNFLNYLLHHDVCPDYRDQVNASRGVCDLAEKELWCTTQLSILLPGDFNRACSEVFGGWFQGLYVANQAWAQGTEEETTLGVSFEHAQNTVRVGLIAHATDEMFKTYEAQNRAKNVHIVNTENIGLEVTEIVYGELDADNQGLHTIDKAKDFRILGKLHAKTWVGAIANNEDLTEDEEIGLTSKPPTIKEYELWVENEVLEVCFEGMKLRATVTELSFGLHYLDAPFTVHCSFYNVLPNQKIMGWREPEEQWLPPRPKDVGQDEGGKDDLLENNAKVEGETELHSESIAPAGNDPGKV